MSLDDITEPGVYDRYPIDAYLADPVKGGSLSASGARRLLPPSCPALFDHARRNPPETSDAFDFGHAAHMLVLGDGPEIAPIKARDWRTKKAQEAAEEARAAGKTPLLLADCERVHAMADALREHPIAAALFRPDSGSPEQTLVWRDGETGTNLRARLDWLPHAHDGRLIVPDYKTTRSANPEKFAKSAADFGYHVQAAWYLAGVHALGLAEESAFVFVAQEKTPPYLVTVVELDVVALRIGQYLMRQAIDTYAECEHTGHWPGYSSDVELVALPYYYERNFEGVA